MDVYTSGLTGFTGAPKRSTSMSRHYIALEGLGRLSRCREYAVLVLSALVFPAYHWTMHITCSHLWARDTA